LVVGVLSFIIILILFGTGMLMSDWGMMGPVGMMENWGYTSPSPLDWTGMVFMWLIPAGFLVLAVFGLAWLVRSVSHSQPPASQGVSKCSHPRS
jgi:hypothetical protein